MKKTLIIILVIIICIITTIFINKNKQSNTKNLENKNDKIVTREEIGKIQEFEEILEENGLNLSNKEAIFSTEINNEGFSYDVNGEKIEIYLINSEKINNILTKVYDNHEIVIRTLNSPRKEGIYYNEILILNCNQNKNKILDIIKKFE